MFKRKKRAIKPEKKKAMLTTFILLFPSMITTMWITFMTNIIITVSAIMLFFFQAVIIKNFVDGHYTVSG